MPDAVEEILRYDSPLRVIKRVSVKESTFHGETVPEGASIFMLYCAANRDERRWPDADDFDIRRKPRAHDGLRRRHPPLHRSPDRPL